MEHTASLIERAPIRKTLWAEVTETRKKAFNFIASKNLMKRFKSGSSQGLYGQIKPVSQKFVYCKKMGEEMRPIKKPELSAVRLDDHHTLLGQWLEPSILPLKYWGAGPSDHSVRKVTHPSELSSNYPHDYQSTSTGNLPWNIIGSRSGHMTSS